MSKKNEAKRVKVSEWWEVWWSKPNCEPVRIQAYGVACDFRIGREGFPTRDAAMRQIDSYRNKYLRIIHVVRYRKTS